jgi:beta-glucuronidase
MLRPQDSATRETKRLDGRWAFALDPDGVGRSEEWFAAPLKDARVMPVPASFNDIAADASVHDYVGDVWYQRVVRVPRGWDGQRIVLHVESATHRATVWVGSTEVVSHEGGYTPFEAEVSAHVVAGEEMLVTVCVNNTLSFQSIPPGVIEDSPTGKKQRYWHDFFNYSGLHRSVWLLATPAAHVDDVTVVTGLEGSTGTVAYEVGVVGADGLEVRVVLRDADGSSVVAGEGASGVLRLPEVHRWAPGDGYLYDLEVQLVDGDEVVDSYHQSVGVRTVEVRGLEFLVNGEPVYFTGFGKHEDIGVLGKAHSDAYLVHDFELMTWMGANSFRTSHYPYSEEVLDYADQQGFLVIDEVAAVGLNMGLGGGIFGGQRYTTFSPETINDVTREVHAEAIRELIARDKNHPSVALWSIAKSRNLTRRLPRRTSSPCSRWPVTRIPAGRWASSTWGCRRTARVASPSSVTC